MAITETLIPVPGRLHTLAVGGHLLGADEIIDDQLGETQETLNAQSLRTVAQTLSDSEKTQVKENLGLANVAMSGSYTDLSNTPTIPTKVSDLTNDAGYQTLELTGELMTSDPISIVGINNKKFQLRLTPIESVANSNVDVGWSWTNRDGAGIAFKSSLPSLEDTYRGAFELFARDASNSTMLHGQPDGVLTWGGYNVITSESPELAAKAEQADVNSLEVSLEESVMDANGLAMCMSLAHLSAVGTTTQITNAEWKYVLLDYTDKILCGIKQDGKSYVYASIAEIMDCINDSYT